MYWQVRLLKSSFLLYLGSSHHLSLLAQHLQREHIGTTVIIKSFFCCFDGDIRH